MQNLIILIAIVIVTYFILDFIARISNSFFTWLGSGFVWLVNGISHNRSFAEIINDPHPNTIFFTRILGFIITVIFIIIVAKIIT